MADTGAPYNIPFAEPTDLVRDWPALSEDVADAVVLGLDSIATSGFRFAGSVYYTSSGAFLKADPLGTGDIGLRAIRVRVVGAGGGGGGCATTGANQNAVAAAGAGGGYAEAFITDIASLDASVVVTRGSGGPGGAAGVNTGTDGGASSFGTLVVATGGERGGARGASALPSSDGTANDPGNGTDGDILARGFPSTRFFMVDPTRVFQNALGGGTTVFGAGVQINVVTTGADGQSATTFGQGGGGGANAQNQGSARAGGAGANGWVAVDCFV